MLTFKKQRVLVIAPHPDDEVYGCGGFIARAKKEGAEVYVLYLAVGTTRDFSKKGLSKNSERINEIKKVAKFLKLDGYRIAFPYDTHHLKLDVIPQKDIIHEIERGDKISLENLKPTIVLAPTPHDYNQDHRAVYCAVVSATRPVPNLFKHYVPHILCYELPYTSWKTESYAEIPQLYISLAKEDLNKKIKALNLYKSQLKGHDGPLSSNGIRALAEFRGLQTGSPYAEAFLVKRSII